MAFELNLEVLGTQVSAADYSAAATALYRFVKLNTSGAVTLCTVAGEKALGVLYNKPTVGEVADVVVEASAVIAIAGATVVAGAMVMTDATGRVVTAATAGSTILGWALEGAAVGENIAIRLATTGVI